MYTCEFPKMETKMLPYEAMPRAHFDGEEEEVKEVATIVTMLFYLFRFHIVIWG